jgi:ATP-dependent Lon protease
MVVFPMTMVPLYIGRDKSIRALEEAMLNKSQVILVTQKNAKDNNPTSDTLSRVGVRCDIISKVSFPDSTIKVLVEAKETVSITHFSDESDILIASCEDINKEAPESTESRVLVKKIKESFDELAKADKRITTEVVNQVGLSKNWRSLCYMLAANLTLKIEEKLSLLETTNPIAIMEKILGFLNGELEIIKVDKKIQSRIKKNIEKSQKEYYLTEQMDAIQKELGGKDDGTEELEEMFKAAKAKGLSADAEEKITRELKKLRSMSPMSAESAVSRNYIELLTSLPWKTVSEENRNIKHAEMILNRDHFGLEKVKDRILEQLAVMQLNPDNKGTIVCLTGPPGVGKTSLAKSIAEAQGRQFVRISLGGVRDEAEIRGHRRTYVGAMPGKIINALKKAGTNNPLILLDEIDKMGNDHKGDPASAMLEVLDPEQNHTFQDHYVEIDYDLSKVLFFCTANYIENIPRPLKDRMEIIKLSTYTDREKFSIATKYLIPKQIKDMGLNKIPTELTDKAVRLIIQGYTKESGVRNLERTIGQVFRKLARKVVGSRVKVKKFKIDEKEIPTLLGPIKFKLDLISKENEIGVTNGMAYTEVGGDILPIEVSVVPGKGALQITGQLGEVMTESVKIAVAYIRSRGSLFGIDPEFFQKHDLMVHVPDGSTPKDGPSAGVTLTTSLLSAVLKIPVRSDVAMTGEVTLRGKVGEIGGLKEKVIAAHKAGCKVIICPKDNEKNIKDIPKEVRDELKFYCVNHVDEVVVRALDINGPKDLFKINVDERGNKPRWS